MLFFLFNLIHVFVVVLSFFSFSSNSAILLTGLIRNQSQSVLTKTLDLSRFQLTEKMIQIISTPLSKRKMTSGKTVSTGTRQLKIQSPLRHRKMEREV